jgi:hypothetical protein
MLPPDTPAVPEFYKAAKRWRKETLERWAAVRRKQVRRVARPTSSQATLFG